jgi:hypothetical protein
MELSCCLTNDEDLSEPFKFKTNLNTSSEKIILLWFSHDEVIENTQRKSF